MNKSIRSFKQGAQAGFTLIELVVVIVILGILAATAIPKFVDMASDARVAKMNAVKGALQTGAALFHAQWLINGSPANIAGAGTVSMEGVNIPYFNGYPDVGGDGLTNTATSAPNSGITLASGNLADYDITTTAATATVLTVLPDASHTACKVTYTQATGTAPAVVDATAVTTANCK